MGFEEFIAWLGTSAALGVVSSILLTIIKKLWPTVQDKLAFVLSVFLAALLSAAAVIIQPMLVQFPPWVNTFWPILTWVAGQIWYELTKPAA